MAVFARDGFHAATLDDVAAEAGLTKGAVYSNFTGKRELFLALLEEQVTRRAQLALSALSGPSAGAAEGCSVTGTAPLPISSAGSAPQSRTGSCSTSSSGCTPCATRRRTGSSPPPGAICGRPSPTSPRTRNGGSGWTPAFPETRWATIILGLSNGLALERLIDPEAVPGDLLATILDRLTVPLATQDH